MIQLDQSTPPSFALMGTRAKEIQNNRQSRPRGRTKARSYVTCHKNSNRDILRAHFQATGQESPHEVRGPSPVPFCLPRRTRSSQVSPDFRPLDTTTTTA
jgi:hypothetical protein